MDNKIDLTGQLAVVLESLWQMAELVQAKRDTVDIDDTDRATADDIATAAQELATLIGIR